jgi:HEPN domain-containing protein
MLAVCHGWVSKGPDERCPGTQAHARQCVDRYVKALLVVEAADFPKTHDLGALIALLSAGKRRN